MKQMTLCYLQRDGKYLMLHRTKKKNDINKGKWIGVGGKLEPGESPYECALREIREETGYTAKSCDFRGIVVFRYNDNPPEEMYLYTCSDFEGVEIECDEGDLAWIDEDKLLDLNIWEGDRIFINLVRDGKRGFHLTLNYKDEHLMDYNLVCDNK
nr:8-oxo-dGTP diphosphatase [uncultured Peptostreptococcus sp.]